VEASGEADNTIVVFTSDNGCEDYFSGLCSCEPMRGGKLTHYEGGARVPMIVRWPGKLQAGALYSGITSLMDLLPTTVAAAGGHLPADRTYDGVNFLPFIAGKAPGQPHDVLIWRRAPLVSIRAGDWKLWEVSDKTRMAAQSPYGDYTLLFNLKVDENETTNVATQNVAKVNELRALITDWEKDKQPAAWPTAHNVTWPVCGKIFTVPI
jgi:arylsulfatase A-like enzyme